MSIKIQHSIRTLRLNVKTEGYAWLDGAAVEVNNVWNFANATSRKAARPFVGPSKWLAAFDLDKLTAGASFVCSSRNCSKMLAGNAVVLLRTRSGTGGYASSEINAMKAAA